MTQPAYNFDDAAETAPLALLLPSPLVKTPSVHEGVDARTWTSISDYTVGQHVANNLSIITAAHHRGLSPKTLSWQTENAPGLVTVSTKSHIYQTLYGRGVADPVTCEAMDLDSTAAATLIANVIGTTAQTHDLIVRGPRDPLAGYEQYATPDWDHYGADAITPATLVAARAFLRLLPKDQLDAPEIAPGSDGTIGLEWVFRSGPLRKLFIDIGPSFQWNGYWRRADGTKDTIGPSIIDAGTQNELRALFQKITA